MKRITLLRTYNGKQTEGEIPEIGLKTIELKWLNNMRTISCIPEGIYICTLVKKSPSFDYPHYNINNVPGRLAVKIHVANYNRELLGCIAVGLKHSDIDGDKVIDAKNSAPALQKLIDHCGNAFELEIKSKSGIAYR